MDVADDPRPESLCFKRPRAIVASRAETLGGDEANRFRTIPLSLVMERTSVSARVRVRENERGPVLFRVRIGNERVDHEIAASMDVSIKSIVCDLRRGGSHTHARKLARRASDGGRRGRALLGDFGGARVSCSRTMGNCLYTVHASLFQCKEPLMSSPIFSAAGEFVNSRSFVLVCFTLHPFISLALISSHKTRYKFRLDGSLPHLHLLSPSSPSYPPHGSSPA